MFNQKYPGTHPLMDLAHNQGKDIFFHIESGSKNGSGIRLGYKPSRSYGEAIQTLNMGK